MTDKGVWDLQDVRDKSLQGDWNYQTPDGPFTLWAWGNNGFPSNRNGMLGLNTITNMSSPVQVGTETTWKAVSASSYWTTATKTDGTLWVWGSGYGGGYGLLGLNAGSQQFSSPTQIGTDTNWSRSHAAYQNGMAVKTNGELFVWGYGQEGAIGENSRTDRSSPVQIGTDTTWSSAKGHFVNGTNNASYAIKTDGTLWAWGINRQNGQLGLNDIADRSSPTQIGTKTNWSWVEIMSNVVLAVNTDGELWTWGYGSNGQLGLNQPTPTKISSPTQLPGTWSQIGGHNTQVLGLKTDGTLWGWGSGGGGANNDTVKRSSPTQIGTDTNWEGVANGTVGGIKNNGTLWIWGSNYYGKLGLNQPYPGTSYSSPVQLPGNYDAYNSWSCGYGRGVFAFKPIE